MKKIECFTLILSIYIKLQFDGRVVVVTRKKTEYWVAIESFIPIIASSWERLKKGKILNRKLYNIGWE